MYVTARVYVCMCVCVYVYMCICVYVYLCVIVWVYAYIICMTSYGCLYGSVSKPCTPGEHQNSW